MAASTPSDALPAAGASAGAGARAPLGAARAVALGFFPSVVTSLIGPFLTLHLVGERHFSVQAAATLVGSTQLLNALLGLVSGRIVDRLDRLLAARLGLVLMAVLPAALLLQGPAPLLFAALLVYGLGCSLFDHAASTHIYAGADPQQARETYSWYYAAHNGGVLLSPLAVYGWGAAGQWPTFVVAAVLHAAVLAWYLLGLRARPGAAPAPARAAARPSWRVPVAAPLPALVAFGLCYSLSYSQFFSTLPMALGALEWAGRPLYPLLVAVNGALVVAMQPLVPPLARRLDSRRLLLLGAALLLTGYVLLAAGRHDVAAVLAFAVLFSAAEVLINLSATDLVLSHAPDGARASWLALYQASRLSGGVGALAGGALLAHQGPGALPVAFAATVVPMLGIAAALAAARSRPPAAPAAPAAPPHPASN